MNHATSCYGDGDKVTLLPTCSHLSLSLSLSLRERSQVSSFKVPFRRSLEFGKSRVQLKSCSYRITSETPFLLFLLRRKFAFCLHWLRIPASCFRPVSHSRRIPSKTISDSLREFNRESILIHLEKKAK